MSENTSAREWIYILLTLFVAGLGYVKSLSDKKKAPAVPSPGEAEDFGEFPEANRRTDQVEEYTDLRNEEIFPEYRFRPEEEGKSAIIFGEEETDTEEIGEIEEEREFDLRQAIIYQEILQRKYD